MKSRQKLNQKTQKGLAAWQRLVLKLPDFTTNSTAPSQGNTKLERTGQTLTKESDRSRENQTRMYVDGKRYRVGNPKHPHHQLYKEEGLETVYEVMKGKSPNTQRPRFLTWFNNLFTTTKKAV